MKLYGTIASATVVNATDISVGVSFGFPSTPDPTNDYVALDVTPPGTLTELLWDQAIADALVTYVNNTYSTSFVRTDVTWMSGGVHIMTL